MAEIRVLGAAELKQVLLLDDVLAGVQQAYLAKAQGKAETFPLVFHDFSPKAADMDIKSGHLGSEGVFGLKLVSFFEDNIRCGQAPLSALVALFSAGTGRPLAVLEGSALTGMRTGAAAALGAKYLARENSRVLLVVGAGHQCVYQVGAMLRAVPSVRRVLLHDAKNPAQAREKATALPSALERELGVYAAGVSIEPAPDLAAAVGQSDIIVTATPSYKPLVQAAWVRPGTHFSCVGADLAGKQELDGAILAGARVYTDDTPQCLAVGEVEMAVKQGFLAPQEIAGELGQVLAGQKPGRTGDGDITVFDTTGIALQDLAAAACALRRAEAMDVGTVVQL